MSAVKNIVRSVSKEYEELIVVQAEMLVEAFIVKIILIKIKIDNDIFLNIIDYIIIVL
jgi:hypothetical protein